MDRGYGYNCSENKAQCKCKAPETNPCTQTMVNANLVIPCQKPDIERIIKVTVKPKIDKIKTIKDKIIFTGVLEIGVEYVACVKDGSQPVHFACFSQDFAGFIDFPCVKPGMLAILEPCIEFTECKITGNRCLNVIAIVKVCVTRVETCICSNQMKTGEGKVVTCIPENNPPCEETPGCHDNTCTPKMDGFMPKMMDNCMDDFKGHGDSCPHCGQMGYNND